ncbi:Zinc finger protein [Lachnellula occidentalis]|uniref:Zinc finger protein n=1 Tax=Lachnellula occidentalis TaxID=215460 RepID=A0A8H8S119_9HELO|nr:Zinc finger protein [Lachnellula occidentalis]
MDNRQGDSTAHGQREESDFSNPLAVRKSSREESRKQYVCNYDNCNKSFTRSDHLQRHRLNHGTGKACPRCSVHFNRPDLLERHLARHRQKDEEAGGYGLGVVETRKRMWRDADGNIVAKRPTLPCNNPAATSQPHIANSENEHQTDSNDPPAAAQQDMTSFENEQRTGSDDYAGMAQNQEPPLTPRSMRSYSIGNDQHQTSTRGAISEDQWALDVAANCSGDDPEMCDFLTNSSWGAHQPQSLSDIAPNPFDDMFNPDTASSFNMPFTTMNNYNWLFDGSVLEADMQMHAVTGPIQNQIYQPTSSSLFYARNANNNFNSTQSNGPMEQDMMPGTSSCTPTQIGFSDQSQAVRMQITSDRPSQRSNSATETSTTASSSKHSRGDESSPGNFSNQHSPRSDSQSSISQNESPVRQETISRPESTILDPFPTFSPNSRKMLPLIDEVTRTRVLDFIIQANPKTPEGTSISRGNSLLSLSAMQKYCDLFFSRFNVTYPLLHQPTFEPSRVEALLMVSVLLLGATYGDKAEHRLAVCIHDVLRSQIFSNAAFQAQPELWVLQTILLVECFGKSRAGQTQHDMAHLFHGLLINLIRRSDCQVVCHPRYERTKDLESNWRFFVDVEQRKRLAYLCFLWDTQHAVLFSQSLCMSAFELRSSLPCNPASWEAECAEDWHRSFSKETETWFLSVLKLYVNPGSGTLPPHLNDLSRLLMLHGLMSLSWDMKRRDQTALGFVGSSAQEKQNRLAESYDAWKTDFDTYCMSMALSLKDNTAAKRDFTRFSTASVAIYHAAHIILNVEIIDLQIYAGATHIIGRPVTSGDYDRSRSIVKNWARKDGSQAAAKAAWHAAHLLRDGIMNLDSWDVNEVFHYPWCLYLSTLTCWAFHFASKDDHDSGTYRSRDVIRHDGAGKNSQAEMSALVSGMTSVAPDGLWKSVGKFSTSGLTTTIARHLSTIRWAVVHEGLKILKGLVTQEEH